MSTVKEKWDRGRKKLSWLCHLMSAVREHTAVYLLSFVRISEYYRSHLTRCSSQCFEALKKNTCLHSIWPEISWSSLCRHTATMLSKLKRKLVFTSFCRHGFFSPCPFNFQLSAHMLPTVWRGTFAANVNWCYYNCWKLYLKLSWKKWISIYTFHFNRNIAMACDFANAEEKWHFNADERVLKNKTTDFMCQGTY